MAYIRRLGPNRYQIIVHIDTQHGPDGRVRKARRSKVVRCSAREVHRLAAEFEAALRPVVERPESERTLEAAAAEWLAERRRATVSSWRKHEERLRLAILPSIGPDTPLRDLRPSVIEELYSHLPPQRAVKVHATLRALLRYATRRGWIERSPLEQVHPPHYRRPPAPFFTDEEWARLREALMAPRWRRWLPLVAFLAVVPIRPGEALALRWDDIDWRHGVVWVRRSLRRPGHHPEWSEGKADATLGARAVDRRTLALLRLQRMRQARERAGYQEWHNLVFCATDGSPLNWDNWRRRVWRPLLEAAGLDYRKPYALRHTGASLLGAAGVDAKVLSQRLGHSSIQTTIAVYRHVISREQRVAARIASALFLGGHPRARRERARERATDSGQGGTPLV